MLMGVTLTGGMEGVGAIVMGMLGTGVTGAVERLSGGVAIGVLGVEGCDGGVSMGDAVNKKRKEKFCEFLSDNK